MNAVASQRLTENWPTTVSAIDLQSDYIEVPLTKDSADKYRFRLENTGEGNILLLHKNLSAIPHAHIIFSGNNNIVLIGERSALNGYIRAGSNCLCAMLGHQHSLRVAVELYSDGELYWGKNSRTYGARLWIEGGRRLVVGDDCMFSEGIKIRTTDHHSIIDLKTGTQLNYQEDVHIGPHVWLGDSVTVQKGVTIGRGSIVGSGSIVTKSIPEAELWVGSPARMLRQGVSWIDSHPASQFEIDELRASFASLSTTS